MAILGTFLFNALIGLALVAATAVFYLAGLPTAYALLAISVIAVLAIIFGEKLEVLLPARRFLAVASLQDPTGWRKVIGVLTSRESVLPAFAMAGCLTFGYANPTALERVFTEKGEIIFLILTFAVIAYGIKQSGYFKYAAFRVLEVCDGNMTRMVLYLFLLSSVLTYVTSNDIVILIMTPIILELCRQSHIRNARLLLLGQFVAANTVSMGLLIGSPTNIIVALDARLDFVDYFLLMVAPTLLTVAISFLVLHFINEFCYKWIAGLFRRDWEHDAHYTMPALVEQPEFSREMGFWIIFFAIVVLAVATVSQWQKSFFWVTVPAFILSIGAIYATLGWARRDGNNILGGQRRVAVQDCITSLPYSIVPFALVFFAIAETLASVMPLSAIYDWLINIPVPFSSMVAMGGTAALVNTVNDLPASAIMGEVIKSSAGNESLARTVFMQSTLASLNIACYITPIGALAGIIWFHIMQQETAGNDVRTPTRVGMVIYGTSHFVLTAAFLAILIPAVNIIYRWMLGSSEQSFANISDVELTIVITIGVVILLGAGLFIANILKRHRVFVGDMRAFLTAASWLQVRSQTGGMLSQLVIASLALIPFATVLWLIEAGSTPSITDFIVWMLVALGSGHFETWFPESPLGKLIAGLVPLAAIFLIIYLYQATHRTEPLKETSRRIARGEIITRRSVIVDYRAWMREFVESVQNRKDNSIFQTVLYTQQRTPAHWEDERNYAAIYVKEISIDDEENLRVVIDEYKLERADEVYLLSERFYENNGARQVCIVVNEIAANLKNLPSAELGQERFSAIVEGEDPEEYAGRLPRIFVWDDLDTAQVADPEMERLLIKLPSAWRDKSGRGDRLAPVVNTVAEKSWKERRRQIFAQR